MREDREENIFGDEFVEELEDVKITVYQVPVADKTYQEGDKSLWQNQ